MTKTYYWGAPKNKPWRDEISLSLPGLDEIYKENHAYDWARNTISEQSGNFDD